MNGYTREGGKVLFGAYPQDAVRGRHAAALRRRALPLPSREETGGWTPMEGYTTDGAYMWYIDLLCGDARFRGVYFDEYKPDTVDCGHARVHSNQYANAYYYKTVYWFRYRPIVWRVLGESATHLLMCAESLPDCVPFQAAHTHNLYGDSHLRAWLNNDFLQTAFSAAERQMLSPIAMSVGMRLNEGAFYDTPYLQRVVHAVAHDLVSVPQQEDMPLSVCKISDYALCRGAYVPNPPPAGNTDIARDGTYWLRNTGRYPYEANIVRDDGECGAQDVQATGVGVLPLVRLRK